MKTKMTIHRSLAELKVADAKIQKAISEIEPIGIKQEDKLVNGKFEEQKFIESAKSNFQSIEDLIKRKQALKNAIVLSNSQTKVKVAGVEMTVADAITEKANAELKIKFIDNLRAKARKATADLVKQNEVISERREAFITATFGNDRSKVKTDELTALTKTFNATNEYSLVDPLNLEEKISKMANELTEFLGEVDAVLSESNAITTIEI